VPDGSDEKEHLEVTPLRHGRRPGREHHPPLGLQERELAASHPVPGAEAVLDSF
jgi:hypothetical protein